MKHWHIIALGIWLLVIIGCFVIAFLPVETELEITHWEIIEQGNVQVEDVWMDEAGIHITVTAEPTPTPVIDYGDIREL